LLARGLEVSTGLICGRMVQDRQPTGSSDLLVQFDLLSSGQRIGVEVSVDDELAGLRGSPCSAAGFVASCIQLLNPWFAVLGSRDALEVHDSRFFKDEGPEKHTGDLSLERAVVFRGFDEFFYTREGSRGSVHREFGRLSAIWFWTSIPAALRACPVVIRLP